MSSCRRGGGRRGAVSPGVWSFVHAGGALIQRAVVTGVQRHDGVVERGVDPDAEAVPQPGAPHDVADRTFDVGEVERHAQIVVLVEHLGKHLGSRGVQVVDAGRVEHDRTADVGHRTGVPEQQLLHRRRIDEGQGGIDADDADPVGGLDLGEPGNVAIGGGAGHPTEHRRVGHGDAGEHDEHRGDDGHEDADLDAQEQGGEERDAQADEIGSFDRGDVAHLAHVEETDHGHDDDGAQGRRGQRLEERGEERHRGQHDGGRDDRGERRAGAGGVVDRRARESTGDRIAPEEPRRDVGHAQPDQLLIGLDVVAVAAGVDLGHRDRLHETHQRDDQRRHGQVPDEGTAEVGQAEGRKRSGDVTHDGHTLGLEIEELHRGDGPDHDDEGGRNTRDEPLEDEQRDHGGETEDQGGAVGVAQRGHDLVHRVDEVVLTRDRDPQEVFDLAEPDDDRRGGGEPDQHGVREEVDQKPEPAGGQHQVHRAHHQREEGGGAEVTGGPLLEQGRQGGGGQQRHDGDRADRQLPRRTEECVDQDRNGGGVEPHFRGQAGQEGVGHTLGHQHRPHREPGREVAAQVASIVRRRPGQDREQLLHRSGCHGPKCTYI